MYLPLFKICRSKSHNESMDQYINLIDSTITNEKDNNF